MQLHMQVLFNAGMPPNITVAEPGDHGATVLGTQGMGVSTPSAAAVALATVGLASDMHMPNVGMFTMGLFSMMLAAGAPIMVLLVGNALNTAGAAPKVHIIVNPDVTNRGIGAFLDSRAINSGLPGKARKFSGPARSSLSFQRRGRSMAAP
jgi:hypothetical protein